MATTGIDFDSITGIHGFSIDLADNTTADFWACGSTYFVVVSTITVDSQTMSFLAAHFKIGYDSAVLNTTLATLATQTSFTLTTGPAEDDALNGAVLIVHDAASAVQQAFGVVADYTGATKTVTLVAAPTFTIAAKDNISFFPPALVPTVPGRTLGVETTGKVTGVVLTDTVTTYTGNTPQTGDNFARLGANGVGLSAIPDLAGVTTLLARLSAVRAGYLDNVNNATLSSATFPTDPADQSLVIAATDATLAAIAALNNLSQANIRTAVGLATANLDTQLDALPTAAELATALGTADDATLAAIAALNNLSAAGVETAVWDTVLASHLAAGSTGAALNGAGAAGDPWITALPGAYGAGSAGNIVGTNLNATVGSRLATAGYTAPLDAAATRTAVGLATANLDTQLDALPTTAELATALGTADDATLVAIAALNNLSAAGVRTAVGLATANLDTQLAAAAAETALVKAKTDALPTDPADQSLVIAATNGILTAISALQDLSAGAAMTLTAGERTAIADATLARTLGTESYAADGAVPTLAQVQFMLLSALTQFGIVATTLTTRQLDGTTAAMTFTLDDATNPTSRVRAS